LTKVYGWFYWAVNLGAAAAFFIIPSIKVNWGYSWAFGVPGIAMAVATLAFWLGTKYYVRRPPAAREEKRMRFFQWCGMRSLIGTNEKPAANFWMSRWRVFPPKKWTERKSVGNSHGLQHVPMFWALFNQVNSTWVVQGGKMAPLSMSMANSN